MLANAQLYQYYNIILYTYIINIKILDDIEENFLQSAKFPKTWLMPTYINL